MRGRLTLPRAVCLLMLAVPAAAWAIPPDGRPVPMELQDKIEADLNKYLILPETAKWQFEYMAPYAGGGDVVCGTVNYQSSLRVYIGAHNFFSIVKRDRIVHSQLQDPNSDVSGEEALKFRLLCGKT